jgi:hypothetical protein
LLLIYDANAPVGWIVCLLAEFYSILGESNHANSFYQWAIQNVPEYSRLEKVHHQSSRTVSAEDTSRDGEPAPSSMDQAMGLERVGEVTQSDSTSERTPPEEVTHHELARDERSAEEPCTPTETGAAPTPA